MLINKNCNYLEFHLDSSSNPTSDKFKPDDTNKKSFYFWPGDDAEPNTGGDTIKQIEENKSYSIEEHKRVAELILAPLADDHYMQPKTDNGVNLNEVNAQNLIRHFSSISGTIQRALERSYKYTFCNTYWYTINKKS